MVHGKFLCYPSTPPTFPLPSTLFICTASGDNLLHAKDIKEDGPPLAQEGDFYNTCTQCSSKH